MCGLVAGISHRDIVPSLMDGLKRLEYRGYDSAGIATLGRAGLMSERSLGNVDRLSRQLVKHCLSGQIGIGHTRWATHGQPSEINAHPQLSRGEVAVVHNGIIENHENLRDELATRGYHFVSDTDTEVIAHLIHAYTRECSSLQEAVMRTTGRLRGTFALAVISVNNPDEIIAARRGSPLLIGVGEKESYLASDVAALLPLTQYFIELEDGDVARVAADSVDILDEQGKVVVRELRQSRQRVQDMDVGIYDHYMQKEIFEQGSVLERTLLNSLKDDLVDERVFGVQSADVLDGIEHIHIVACGTSYHAGLVAAYTLEALCGVSCKVDIASEYRYRRTVVNPGTLFVTLSQSGETADTLSALRIARRLPYKATLSICNVPESSLVRESDLVFLTQAGPEIGVASTKAFTTQLIGLSLLAVLLARYRGLSLKRESALIDTLRQAPELVTRVYGLDANIAELGQSLATCGNTLFLGRGQMYPIAMEGALKLKELAYIHSDAYAAGELKHGPLALVDETKPVIALAPSDPLLAKLKSNLSEVRARGGRLILFADEDSGFQAGDGESVVSMPKSRGLLTPIVYAVPLQLLAYHTALACGTNVDQPRNLAKSVTVE